jgi:hypothetical protein
MDFRGARIRLIRARTDLAEVLPLQLSMTAKLRLVRGSERQSDEIAADREDCYRYPAHDEVWEVSCEPNEREPRRKQKLTDDRRRAS